MVTQRAAAYRVFQPGFLSQRKAYDDAAAFATQVGPERLITIQRDRGTIVVWYWEAARAAVAPPAWP
jgi:hypothetical protein